jgi:hypothetical protein
MPLSPLWACLFFFMLLFLGKKIAQICEFKGIDQ